MSVVNFNDTTPAPPTAMTNIKWQSDASGNISAGISSVQTVTTATADYTANNSDTYINAISGATNIYLPANPTANQIIAIKNAYLSPGPITVNGNGHTLVSGSQLFLGVTIQYWFDASASLWKLLGVLNQSNWLNWTPTVTAAGSMTVSGVTVNEATWQWLNATSVLYRLAVAFTLGGTASGQVNIAGLPMAPLAGQIFTNLCWVQQPADASFTTQYFSRPDASLGLIVRNAASTNLTLGAYVVSTHGDYRMA
jgi:hypothetical protein